MTDPLDQAGQPPRAGHPRAGDPPTPAANSPIRAGDPPAPADANRQLARAVARCAADTAFLAELQNILDQADRAARRHRFKCRQCGECCRFEQFGHRLYVTAGELALMLHFSGGRAPGPIGRIRPLGIFDNPPRRGALRSQSLGDRSGNLPADRQVRNGSRAKPASQCPHQDQARCLARAGRALGCRLFFCDPAASEWFGDAYEGFHRRIKLLHAAHGLPYVYAELTAALAELASAE